MSISKDTRVQVFRSDRWLCHWCGRPVIFSPVMRHLERLVRQAGFGDPLAYHHNNWTRHHAPLLDHMGAEIDHVEVRTPKDDERDNLTTACHKCNTRKGKAAKAVFAKKWPYIPVKGKYGEPVNWDGLSTLFVVLVEQSPKTATKEELDWLKALKKTRG